MTFLSKKQSRQLRKREALMNAITKPEKRKDPPFMGDDTVTAVLLFLIVIFAFAGGFVCACLYCSHLLSTPKP